MRLSTRKITMLAMLIAIALSIWVLEAQVPAPVPIPGIKLGLANIVSLFTLFWMGRREAFTVLILRVVLGSMFTGNVMTMIYSLSGGLLSLAVIALFRKTFSMNTIWLASVVSGVFHNIGQILCAIVVLGSPAIASYLPVLLISGIISGLFTGLACQYLVKRLQAKGNERFLDMR